MKRIVFIPLSFFILFLLGSPFASAQNEAALEFKPSVTEAKAGDEFAVDVIVKNPGQQAIISVRAWLEYDANALEGLSVSSEGSPFTLSAPGEDTFAPQENHVKIGRSNIMGGMKDAEAKVATVRFRVKTSNPVTTVISPYDYQVTELGHTSINIIDQGFPVNILTQAPESIKIKLNSGAAALTTPPVTVEPQTTLPSEGVGGPAFALNRPQNLKADTGSGYVDFKWDTADEADRLGYNLYWGKISGQYTRMRNIGNVNSYRLDGLNDNEAYYFAISAYDALNRETDYSDEVGILINQPLSSTSPFEEMLSALLARIPAQPQNGPLTWWILFSAFGLSGVVLFRTKKQA